MEMISTPLLLLLFFFFCWGSMVSNLSSARVGALVWRGSKSILRDMSDVGVEWYVAFSGDIRGVAVVGACPKSWLVICGILFSNCNKLRFNIFSHFFFQIYFQSLGFCCVFFFWKGICYLLNYCFWNVFLWFMFQKWKQSNFEIENWIVKSLDMLSWGWYLSGSIERCFDRLFDWEQAI